MMLALRQPHPIVALSGLLEAHGIVASLRPDTENWLAGTAFPACGKAAGSFNFDRSTRTGQPGSRRSALSSGGCMT